MTPHVCEVLYISKALPPANFVALEKFVRIVKSYLPSYQVIVRLACLAIVPKIIPVYFSSQNSLAFSPATP